MPFGRYTNRILWHSEKRREDKERGKWEENKILPLRPPTGTMPLVFGRCHYMEDFIGPLAVEIAVLFKPRDASYVKAGVGHKLWGSSGHKLYFLRVLFKNGQRLGVLLRDQIVRTGN